MKKTLGYLYDLYAAYYPNLLLLSQSFRHLSALICRSGSPTGNFERKLLFNLPSYIFAPMTEVTLLKSTDEDLHQVYVISNGIPDRGQRERRVIIPAVSQDQ